MAGFAAGLVVGGLTLPVWGYDINVLILKNFKENRTVLDLKNSGVLYDRGVKQLAQSRLLRTVR
ncbi:MAG: hypothetical protein GWO19_23055, partial [Nitrospinaceae bacterium]|nr:hypothetical protein [Nitrospinaceae bacterium]